MRVCLCLCVCLCGAAGGAYQLPDPTTVTLCLCSIIEAAGSRRSAILKAGLELKYRRVKRAPRVLGRDRRAVRSIKQVGGGE